MNLPLSVDDIGDSIVYMRDKVMRAISHFIQHVGQKHHSNIILQTLDNGLLIYMEDNLGTNVTPTITFILINYDATESARWFLTYVGAQFHISVPTLKWQKLMNTVGLHSSPDTNPLVEWRLSELNNCIYIRTLTRNPRAPDQTVSAHTSIECVTISELNQNAGQHIVVHTDLSIQAMRNDGLTGASIIYKMQMDMNMIPPAHLENLRKTTQSNTHEHVYIEFTNAGIYICTNSTVNSEQGVIRLGNTPQMIRGRLSAVFKPMTLITFFAGIHMFRVRKNGYYIFTVDQKKNALIIQAMFPASTDEDNPKHTAALTFQGAVGYTILPLGNLTLLDGDA